MGNICSSNCNMFFCKTVKLRQAPHKMIKKQHNCDKKHHVYPGTSWNGPCSMDSLVHRKWFLLCVVVYVQVVVWKIFYFHPYLGKIPNLTNIFQTEREPVRPCNFHTVVIGGFVAHTGPFQLKWCWFLYRPKMVLLVVVTPKYVGFGYYVGDMPHKFINQKPKNSKKTKKTKETKKNNPLEETLGHNISPETLVFLVSLVFLVFFEFFVSFPSPVADESFRV